MLQVWVGGSGCEIHMHLIHEPDYHKVEHVVKLSTLIRVHNEDWLSCCGILSTLYKVDVRAANVILIRVSCSDEKSC